MQRTENGCRWGGFGSRLARETATSGDSAVLRSYSASSELSNRPCRVPGEASVAHQLADVAAHLVLPFPRTPPASVHRQGRGGRPKRKALHWVQYELASVAGVQAVLPTARTARFTFVDRSRSLVAASRWPTR